MKILSDEMIRKLKLPCDKNNQCPMYPNKLMAFNSDNLNCLVCLVDCNLKLQLAQDEAEMKEAVENLTQVYDEYIKLLGDELNDLTTLAYVHSWQSPRVKQGEKCRNKIDDLKAQYLKEG